MTENSKTSKDKSSRLKVEIWSDVLCPFCYIGKRRFEKALRIFPFKDDIEVVWKSFLLNPNMLTNPNISVYESLAKSKGWTVDYARNMSIHVSNIASEEGLFYNFDQAVVANSLNAHRLLQYAKTKELGDALKEQLLKAYFTDGQNIDDFDSLIQLGITVGLPPEEVQQVVHNRELYFEEVQNDIREARTLQINGVPFFVFSKKYEVSGAQQVSTFTQTLEKAHSEWSVQQKKELDINSGRLA